MSNVTTYSKKETELRELCQKKFKLKNKRYYVPHTNDELNNIFNKSLKENEHWDIIDSKGIKFAVHYVYPYIQKTTWAHIFHADPHLKMYSDIDYIIEVSGQIWELLDEEQKNILIEHELEHLYITETDEGEVKQQLQTHDLEDFVKIIKKYGIDWVEQKTCIESQFIEMEAERKAKEKAEKKQEKKASGNYRGPGRPKKNP